MAFTKAQLEALKNSLLASNQPILASQHRQQIQSIIDEMYDAQSRANILVGVQSDSVQGSSDTFLVFRSGQAYQLPVSLLNANELASLGDVFINNLEDGDSLVYDAVANRWENRSILLGFELSNLTDVQLSSLAGGDILRYNSTSSRWENVSLASLLAPYALLTDLDAYQLLSAKGQPNGYASLDGGGKVPANQLPSFVDDVLEFSSLSAFPTTGETGKIYVALDTNKTYRWSGSAYIEISPSDVNSVFGRTGIVTAQSGDYASFYVTLDTAQTITGSKIFSLDTTINGIQIGRGAGNVITNTRIGFNTLASNTTGSNNTASGYEALLSNTNGNSNTAYGFFAGRSNTSGNSNVFIGVQSLSDSTTGSNNTAIGNNAGRFIADGITVNTITNNSVFLGGNSRSLGNNEFNQIVIGPNAIGKGSNTVTIGNTSTVSTHLFGNIHASKGGTNEAILSYSNTAVRTYTLPDASGNIVLGTIGAGQVAFGNAQGAIVGDSGLVWDNVNKRLGIGIANPQSILNLIQNNGNNVADSITLAFGASDFGNTANPKFINLDFIGHSSFGNIKARIQAEEITGTTRKSDLIFYTKNSDTSGITEKWRMTHTGVFESNGAQIIRTSTGDLRLETGGGNGNIILSPNGSGVVVINSITTNTQYAEFGRTADRRLEFSNFIVGTRNDAGHRINARDSFGVIAIAINGVDRLLINQSGNVGIGTNAPWARLSIPFNDSLSFGSSSFPFSITRSSGGQLITTFADNYNDATTRIDFVMRNGSANQNTALSISGSGNVGIGTTSPSAKLQVNGNINIATVANATGDFLTHTNGLVNKRTASQVRADIGAIAGTIGNTQVAFGNSAGAIVSSSDFTYNDSTKSLGIGVSQPRGSLDVFSNETLRKQVVFPYQMVIGKGDGGYGTIAYNADYRDATSNIAGVKYLTGDTISQLEFVAGGFIFRSAPSGTTGNVATLTERFRLTETGNIGLGTSNFGFGSRVIGIANATTVPSANPSGGGVLYVEGGALKYRGSSGTITTIANA